MNNLSKKIIAACLIIASFIFSSAAFAAEHVPVYYDFNSMPAFQLIDTIKYAFCDERPIHGNSVEYEGRREADAAA